MTKILRIVVVSLRIGFDSNCYIFLIELTLAEGAGAKAEAEAARARVVAATNFILIFGVVWNLCCVALGIRDRQQTGFCDVCFLERTCSKSQRKLSSSSPLKTSSRIDGSLLPAERLVEQSTRERYAQGRKPRLHADAS